MQRLYGWIQIEEIPESAGIYAWYYIPMISDNEIEKLKVKITEAKHQGEHQFAYDTVLTFLQVNVFKAFQEEPYRATLEGQLKPRYGGDIEHIFNISEELIERIVEQPERLSNIKSILQNSIPEFASPIYIGMSELLRQRLRRHKSLIQHYFEYMQSETSNHRTSDNSSHLDQDQSFALEIFRRKLVPSNLYVAVRVIEDTESFLDIENLLNRLYYPLLGRN